ncbi:hypothetical protein RvY_03298 [Ramazzottius varieornatus]|uniref:Uncharacterized protein n=1 Tax=Ramazzottius varieornatus TaxID=947166 RepID=A0A1D1UND7_RAMVA|nr:hypothetical protein RvY_03298 [Ramazzottius varieornatus]
MTDGLPTLPLLPSPKFLRNIMYSIYSVILLSVQIRRRLKTVFHRTGLTLQDSGPSMQCIQLSATRRPQAINKKIPLLRNMLAQQKECCG